MAELPTPDASALDPLLAPKKVCEITSLSLSEIHRRRQAGTFPDPEPIGDRRVAYRQSVIAAWLADPMGWGRTKPAGAGRAA